jgi:EAL domain-containing protein (putative c-di-GMP-specific phosphodiesterase class I)
VSVDVVTNVDSSVIRRVVAQREVRVVYQPVVDLKTQKTFAYEALVRSNAPEFTNPMELFAAAVAEECTGELGRLIRELALEGCNTHPLFLNVHPAELNEKWVVQPNDPIFQHDHDVYLEITEGVPLSHFRLCQSILREVRGRGVYLVVDDLGAGYSNLRYIADLHPINPISTVVRNPRLVGPISISVEHADLVIERGDGDEIGLPVAVQISERRGHGVVTGIARERSIE